MKELNLFDGQFVSWANITTDETPDMQPSSLPKVSN